MAKYNKRIGIGYGIGTPLPDLHPSPIIGQRDPTSADNGYPQGQVWINESNNNSFILTSVSGGAANWEQSSGNEIDPPVEIGNSTTREGSDATDWSADGNMLQVYADDGAATGANYRKAGRFDLTVSSGDGTDSPQALRGQVTALTGSHHEEVYAGYFWANQDDGAELDSNLIGLVSAAYMEETDAADAPAQWTYGLQGILTAADTAAAPGGTSIQAGIASYVTYNTPFNSAAHGYVAARNGGGAGGTAGAAYKVLAGSAIISDWEYAIDLYNGATGLAYNTADIRLWNQATILSSATDVTMTLPDTTEFIVTMTDSDNFLIGNTVDGTFAGAIESIHGTMTVASGASLLQGTGTLGFLEQQDGSAISSTASGVEGWLNLLETDNADLPAVYAFAVKGYLDGADATGIPGGIVAGIGSIVEYVTPFNAKAYGVAVSRLDSAGGTGTAGAAAFGVVQGTVAAADWLYGLDFAAATSGFTNADVRFQNSSTIAVDTEGVTFSGDVATRSIAQTNTKVTFNANPLGQLVGQAGALVTGANGTVNDLLFQDGVAMQNFMIAAGGQTKILPVMEAEGLEIALDLAANEGQEMNFGVLASNKHAYTIGTSAAFFVEARFKVADVSGCEPLLVGFRKQEANNAVYTTYTDYATIGIVTSQNADLITLATELNAGGTTYTNTTDAFTDGQTHTLRVNVDASGNVTYLIDGAAPSATAAFQFDNGDVVMPFIHLLHAAVAPGKIHLISMEAGYQAWT